MRVFNRKYLGFQSITQQSGSQKSKMKIFTIKSSGLFLLFILATLFSCQKKLEKTRDQLLTDHEWVYYQYVVNYSQPSALVVYKIEKPDNTLDLSLHNFKFNLNRTFQELIGDGTVRGGTWNYNAAAEMEVKDGEGKTLFTIVTLDGNYLTWANQTEDTFGSMSLP